jgi:predicted DNA-binding WGR domain protein
MTEKITLPQLKNLCKDRGIRGYSKLNKKEIILLIDSTLSNKDDHPEKRNEFKTIKEMSNKDDKSDIVKKTKTIKDEHPEKMKKTKTIKDEHPEKMKKTKTIKENPIKNEDSDIVKETKTIKEKSIKNEDSENEIMGKIITKHYKLKDDKSDKFWEIIYEDINDEKKKYKVRYGKEGTDGTYSKIKEDTLKKIEEIIISKVKKGYVNNK